MAKISKHFENLSERMYESAVILGDRVDEKVNLLGNKLEYVLQKTDEYLGRKVEGVKKDWKSLSPAVRKDIKRGALYASIACVTPWYIALPVGYKAYKKARKVIRVRKRYPNQ